MTLDLLLHALAVFRLTLMVSRESGPFWMFKHLRRVVKRRAPRATHMDEGIECAWCVSLQFAALVALLRLWLCGNVIYDTTILALALSAAAILTNEILLHNTR